MSFAFVRNLIGIRTDTTIEKAIAFIVALDPETATEAELRTMEQSLDSLGLRVEEAKQAYEKEKREADEIEKLYEQRMAAAEALSKKMDETEDPTQKAAIDKSLHTLLDMLTPMAADVDVEREEAKSAKEFLDELTSAYNMAGEKLRNARKELTSATRQLKRSELEKERAARQAEAARQATGLAEATTGIGTALKAMQDRAEKNLQEAGAARRKADLLRPSNPEEDDPIIKEALRAASGAPPQPTSAKERLAALRR